MAGIFDRSCLSAPPPADTPAVIVAQAESPTAPALPVGSRAPFVGVFDGILGAIFAGKGKRGKGFLYGGGTSAGMSIVTDVLGLPGGVKWFVETAALVAMVIAIRKGKV